MCIHKVTVVSRHRMPRHSRLSNPHQKQKVQHRKVLDFLWWGRTDSNHRSVTQQIYSLSPLATRELPHIQFCLYGAGRRTRTPDLLITNQLLYQLSYTGDSNRTRLLYSSSAGLSRTFFANLRKRKCRAQTITVRVDSTSDL